MSDVIHIISTPLKKKLLSKKYIPQMPRFISLILRKCYLFYAVQCTVQGGYYRFIKYSLDIC